MPVSFRRPAGTNGKFRPKTRRKGVSIAKARYKRPTARNQKGLILANARAINRLVRDTRKHRVWSDWQYSSFLTATPYQWSVAQLTDFTYWENVLRADLAVSRKAHTFIQRCSINFRFILNDASWMGLNVFVVTPRKYASDIDPFATQPILGQDYIEPQQTPGFNIRLNSGVYKVHWSRYLTLTRNAFNSTAIADENVGNPNTTWGKSTANIRMNLSLTNPVARTGTADSWLDIPFSQLPYYGKYMLLCFPAFPVSTGTRPLISFDALFTTINAS